MIVELKAARDLTVRLARILEIVAHDLKVVSAAPMPDHLPRCA